MTTIRRITANDLADVVGIYNEHVRHSVATFDTEPVGVNHFAPRVLAREAGDDFLVAEETGRSSATPTLGSSAPGRRMPGRARPASTSPPRRWVGASAATS